jgi:uridine phosphorylase
VEFIGDAQVAREDGPYDARRLLGHHSATLSVTPLAERRSLVTYDVTVDDDDVTAASIGQGYGAAIVNLKELLEA